MAISKVVFDGDTLMDITDSTVSEDSLLDGFTAYGADGEKITGGLKLSDQRIFVITEDICTVEVDTTKGVSPYNTSYGYTGITIDADSDVDWVEGGIYNFIISTKLVVESANRNIRIRIGESGTWIPVMGSSSSILAGSSYFTKAVTRLFVYKSTYQTNGALHMLSDDNTTYAYLVNTFDAGSVTIDENGYGARYSQIFATTPISNVNTRWSSLVKSSSTGSTKAYSIPKGGKFYIDRPSQYIYSANILANETSINATYQEYQASDIRYTANATSTYVSTFDNLYLWLKNFDPSDMSFVNAECTYQIVSAKKLATAFPSTVENDVYLYWLGCTGTSWYVYKQLNEKGLNRFLKYIPSTGTLSSYAINGVTSTSQLTNDTGFVTGDIIKISATEPDTEETKIWIKDSNNEEIELLTPSDLVGYAKLTDVGGTEIVEVTLNGTFPNKVVGSVSKTFAEIQEMMNSGKTVLLHGDGSYYHLVCGYTDGYYDFICVSQSGQLTYEFIEISNNDKYIYSGGRCAKDTDILTTTQINNLIDAKITTDYYTKTEIDTMYGDIHAALQTILGGGN